MNGPWHEKKSTIPQVLLPRSLLDSSTLDLLLALSGDEDAHSFCTTERERENSLLFIQKERGEPNQKETLFFSLSLFLGI